MKNSQCQIQMMRQPFEYRFLRFGHIVFDVFCVNRQQIEFTFLSYRIINNPYTATFARSRPVPAQLFTATGVSYGVSIDMLPEQIFLKLLEGIII